MRTTKVVLLGKTIPFRPCVIDFHVSTGFFFQGLTEHLPIVPMMQRMLLNSSEGSNGSTFLFHFEGHFTSMLFSI